MVFTVMVDAESSAFAELLPTLAATAELDMLEARDTRWPESFITMASQSRKSHRPREWAERRFCVVLRGEGRKGRHSSSAGRFSRGAEPSYRRTIAGIWRGGFDTCGSQWSRQRNDGSKNTMKDGLETARLKHPKRWLAQRTAARESLASLKARRMKPSIDEAETGLLLGVNRSEKEEVW